MGQGAVTMRPNALPGTGLLRRRNLVRTAAGVCCIPRLLRGGMREDYMAPLEAIGQHELARVRGEARGGGERFQPLQNAEETSGPDDDDAGLMGGEFPPLPKLGDLTSGVPNVKSGDPPEAKDESESEPARGWFKNVEEWEKDYIEEQERTRDALRGESDSLEADAVRAFVDRHKGNASDFEEKFLDTFRFREEHEKEEFDLNTDDVSDFDPSLLPPPKPLNFTMVLENGENVSIAYGQSFHPNPHPYLLMEPDPKDLDTDERNNPPELNIDYTKDLVDKALTPYMWKIKFGEPGSRAELEEPPEVFEPETVLIMTISAGWGKVNSVIVADPVSREGLLFDPSGMGGEIMDVIRNFGITIKAIVLSNGLFYHAMDIRYCWKRLKKPPIYLGEDDVELYQEMQQHPKMLKIPTSDQFSFPSPLPPVTNILKHGTKLPILNCTAIHLPGITPGSFAFHFNDDEFVFVGEALEKAKFPECSYDISDEKVLRSSIKRRIFTLPPKTKLLYSRGPWSDVQTEIYFNKLNASLNRKERVMTPTEQYFDDLRLEQGQFLNEKEKMKYIEKVKQESIERKVKGFDPTKLGPRLKRRFERLKMWKKETYFPDRISNPGDINFEEWCDPDDDSYFSKDLSDSPPEMKDEENESPDSLSDFELPSPYQPQEDWPVGDRSRRMKMGDPSQDDSDLDIQHQMASAAEHMFTWSSEADELLPLWKYEGKGVIDHIYHEDIEKMKKADIAV